MRPVEIFLAIVSVGALFVLQFFTGRVLAPPAPAPTPQQVEIIRDNRGVPHIFAADDNGAFFGWGYATAEDRMFQMHWIRMYMQGRLAELVGYLTKEDPGEQVMVSTIDEDIKMRQMQFNRYAEERFSYLDTGTREALQAYSAGVNRYISDNQANLLYLFGGLVPEPWTPVHSLLAWDYLGILGVPSEEAVNLHQFESLVQQYGSPRAAAAFMVPKLKIYEIAAIVKQSDVPQATQIKMQSYAAAHPSALADTLPQFSMLPSREAPAPKGSQAWVVGKNRMTNGAVNLVSHPQLPKTAPETFHEAHVAGATFNARGITVPGALGFFVGFNQNVAWGATAAAADIADLFRLKMLGPNTYEFDGAPFAMQVYPEQIFVKNGSPVNITAQNTILGPVVTPLVQGAFPSEEYALRMIPQYERDTHTVQGLLAMMRAGDVYAFHQALEFYRAPAVHIIFGDRNGDIGYQLGAAIPARSHRSILAGMVAQDGSLSNRDWVEIIPYDVRPHVLNPAQGAIVAANQLPVGEWYPISLGAGPIGGGDTVRSEQLKQLVYSEAPFYTAPLIFTPADVAKIILNDVNFAKREIVEAGLHMRDVQGAPLSRDARNTLLLLKQWLLQGAHNVTTNPYQAAAHYMDTQFRTTTAPNLVLKWGDGEPGLTAWLRDVNQRLQKNPLGAILNADEIAFIDNSLAKGWTGAVANHGPDPSLWQASFAANEGTLTSPFMAFKGFPSLDPLKEMQYPGVTVAEIGTIRSQKAQVYTQWVNFKNTDTAQAILPMGNSEDPASPHFNDQAPMWLAGTMHAAPLSYSAVQAIKASSKILNYTF